MSDFADGLPVSVNTNVGSVSARSRFLRDQTLVTASQGPGSAEQAKLDYSCLIVCNDLGIVVRASLPQEISLDMTSSYEAPFAQGLVGGLPGIGSIARTLGLQLTTQALTAEVWQGSGTVEFQMDLQFQVEDDVNSDVLEPLMKLMFLTVAREETEGGLLSAPGPHIDLKQLSESSAYQTAVLYDKVKATAERELADQQSVAAGVAAAKKKLADGTQNMINAITGTTVTQAIDSAVQWGIKVKNGMDQVAQPLSAAIVGSIKNNISLYIGRYMYFPSVVITDVSQTHKVQPMIDGNFQYVSATVRFKTFYQPTQRDIAIMFPSASADLRNQINARSGPSRDSGTGDTPTAQPDLTLYP